MGCTGILCESVGEVLYCFANGDEHSFNTGSFQNAVSELSSG
ncbi:MAG: hypothetical protein WCJ47_06570 [Methanomicrobiales archaeon]